MLSDSSRFDQTRRIIRALLFVCSAGLLAASVYRAATYPFTGDESLSFAVFTWDPRLGESANNHLLNTWLMWCCSQLLGNSELSLRLPNVLAHALYLASSLALLKRFEHPALLLAGFVLLNLNPFLLDFFSLARGYGLALAFTMSSLYLLARAYEQKQRLQGFLKPLCLCASAGALAVLANYAFLNYYLPLLAACAWLLLTDASLRRFSRSHIVATVALLSTSGTFLAFVLSDLFRLQRSGALYAGGRDGFISDTVGSLARSSLYSIAYTYATEKVLVAFVTALFVALILFGLCLIFFRKKVTLFELLLLMLAVAVALPVLQHQLLNTLFPIDRAALFYLPLYAAALLCAARLLWQLSRRRWGKVAALILPAALAVAVGWHFCRSFNTRVCYLWWFDAHNDEVIEIIARDHESKFPGRTVRLGNSWMMEPSLSFYRATRDHRWLEPVTRNPISAADNDYIYAFESEVQELTEAGHTRLASYPDSQTVLLRVNHAPAP